MDVAITGTQSLKLEGYMLKRNTPVSPPTMQKGYFLLHGTCLLEFATEDDATSSFRPREEYEVIGVSNWDGKGRANVYPNAFLAMTHLGTTLYFSCDTNVEKEAWIASIRCALECCFANVALSHLKPPKDRFPPPQRSRSLTCNKTNLSLAPGTAQFCAGCGRAYLPEHCKECLPLIQLGLEVCARLCVDCASCQSLVLWLKTFNYHYLMAMHSAMAELTKDPHTYSASVGALRKSSHRIEMAGKLLDSGSISLAEFEELVLVDQRYNSEERREQTHRFRRALRFLGNDVHTLIMFIVDAAQNKKSPRLFEVVLERLLEIAMGSVDDDSFDDVDDDERVTPEARSRSTEADIEVVEFFWPQLMQLHLLLSRKFTPQTTALVDGLQTFLLLLAGRHFVLAQKLAWGLAGSLEDCKGSNPAQLTHSQYVSCLSLLFQLEKVVTGSIGLLDGTTSGGSNPVFSELTSVSSHHKAILMQHFALLFANRSSRYASWLRFSPNNVASGLDEDAHQDLTAQSSLLLMDSMAEVGPIFLQQMNFLARLTYIVDMLRFVDREKRKLQLLEYMRQLELELDGTMGYSPITSASEPVLQIVKIVKDSCHVFRTKARAPSLIVAEVVQAQAAPLTRRRKHFATEGIQGEELEKLVEHHQNSLMQGMEMQEHGQGPDAAAETNDGASEGKSDGAEMVPGPSTSTACFLGQTTQSAGESGRLLEPRTPFKSATYTQERVTDAQQHAAELIAMLETQGIRSPAAAEQTTFSSEQGLSALPPGSSVELVQRRPRDTSDEQPAGQVKQIINTARQLLSDGEISDEEFRQLLRNDSRFREVSRRLDEEFWIARRFGESWTEKVARLRATSEFGTMAGWNLCSFIVKSNDDLRQEMCCMQMIELCSDIFRDANLDLRLRPYRIISTSARTGLVETLVDTISLDALKKTDDFVDLPTYFAEVYSGSEERLSKAKHAFASSLAAYSLLCYLLMIKDRHNGNILIDRDGHMVHIDFGFIMGIAPGGSFSLETAPFKLTSEMVDVLGGFRSPLFNEFVRLFVAGFVALQANAETIVKSFELLAYSSPFPCLVGQDPQRVVERFRTRFRQELKRDDTARFCMDLIVQSYNNYGARQYDYYQWYTNSIMP